MDLFILAVFIATYLGMALGRVPGLGVDRTGIALLAAIVLQTVAPRDGAALVAAIDFETLAILFGLMVVSIQFAACGFHDRCAHWLANAACGPFVLLALVVGVAGGLAALLTNDVVALAMTPMLTRGLMARGLDPKPYLIALAGAANAGSAATLIGNPQNILIAQTGDLDLLPFLGACLPPALIGMACCWACVAVIWRAALRRPAVPPAAPPAAPPATMAPPAVDRSGLIKGLVATALLLVLFLTPLDRATAALIVAGLILTSRRLRSRDTLGLVDWQLLILFVGLFVVVDSFTATGLPSLLLDAATTRGLDPLATGPMVALTLAGSNTIGNVPLITLWLSILPAAPTEALYRLAVFSTLAGNFLLIGSIANLIVADQAARQGVSLGFLDHARCGVPMTLLSLGFAWGWFALIA